MAALREGDRISNYLLEALLGKGSFGEVWRARHHVFDEVVAIKIPTDPQYVRNLQREGVAIHGLKHPNVVRAIDLDPYATPPYLVMEIVEGPSLRETIDKVGAGFPVGSAVAVMEGILCALEASHNAGLIHRDIKPANVLLNHPIDEIESIRSIAVKVTDFGLGRVGGETTQSILKSGNSLTADGRSISGTLAYMSPEQKEGLESDPQSDVYSCGIVLFEMLTGERPQGSDLPSSLRPELPVYLDKVFERCYTRKERRYASAREMLDDLTPAPPGGPPPPPPAGHAARGSANVCPSCRAQTYRDDQFCIACGHQLVGSVPHCSKCRAHVHRDDRFCIFCGNDLRVLAD